MKTALAILLAVAAPACAADPMSTRGGAGGKADAPDPCAVHDWYADGVCDDFCVLPDPDCSSFERFEIERAGVCPESVDCAGFLEISSDRTLRQDGVGDPDAAIGVASIAGVDLASALGPLTSPELVALLGAAKPPCPVATDVTEVMVLDVAGVETTQPTALCDAPPLVAARRAMAELGARYLPGEFVSFRIATEAFCAPTVDCSGFVELGADGALRLDRTGERPTVVHEATISADDLAAALVVVMAPDSLAGLAGEAPCEAPTDLHEVMTIDTSVAQHSQVTTLCDAAYLVGLRDAMQSLVDDYLPAR